MNNHISTYSHRYLHDQLCLVERWAESLGIGLSHSRLRTVRETVGEIISGGVPATVDGRTYVRNHIDVGDALSYLDIYRMLSQQNSLPNEMILKLRRAIQAPQSADEDSDLSGGRNYLFEFQLASFFNEVGLQVTSFDDISFNCEGYQFYIECKRPLSLRQIGHRIRQAYEQLQLRCPDGRARGLIAISADKIVFPHEYLNYIAEDANPELPLDCFVVSSASESQFLQSIRQMTQGFQDRYRQSWSRLVDPRVIGIILVFRFLFRNNEMVGQAFVPTITPLFVQAVDTMLVNTILRAFERRIQ